MSATITKDYESESVKCAYLSGATPEECEQLIGKTVAKVIAREYSVELVFTDGTTFEASGHTCSDSALTVEVIWPAD